MRKRKITNETTRICQMLEFFLLHTPLGLLPFMNDNIDLPSSREIIDILSDLYSSSSGDLGVRITGGEHIPEALRYVEKTEPYTAIITEYGGIEQIRTVLRDWETRYPQRGKMIRLWSVKGSEGARTMADVADNSGYTDASVPYRVRQSFLIDIAYDIYVRRYVLVRQERF